MQQNIKEQYLNILSSWIEYLELEKLSNLKISTSKLKDYKRVSFNDKEDKGVRIEGNRLVIFIPKKIRENLKEENQIYLGFPILEEKGSYLPLFVIKMNADKNLEKIEFDTESFNDFTIAKPILIALGFEPQEIDELTKNKPLLSLLKDFLYFYDSENYNDLSFKAIYEKFKKWLKKKIDESRYRLASFDFVVTTNEASDFEYFEGQKVETILKDLLEFPLPEESLASYKYLFGKQNKNFEEYNKCSFVPWFGTFHTFELSKGQALLLQKKAEGENLIAVQGPPGTGKTTVLMAVIASTLTERALSIARGNDDFSTLILIASTANKAVKNAAREFEDKDKFKEIPIYSEGYGFYFNGGNKKNISSSLVKVDNLIEHLKEASFNYDEYEKIREELLNLRHSLDMTSKTIKLLIKKLDEIKLLNQRLYEVETKLNEISNQSTDFFTIVNADINELEENIKKTKYWFNSLNSLGIRFEELPLVANETFGKNIAELKQHLQKYNVFEKVIDLFVKKKRKKIEEFLLENQETLNILGIKMPISTTKAILLLSKLEDIYKTSLYLLREKPSDIYLYNLSQVEEIFHLKLKKSSFINELTVKKKQLKEFLKEKKLDSQLDVDVLVNNEWDFLSLWKLITVKANRDLFITACKFLYLETLKQKDNVIESLKAFKLLMNKGQVSEGREKVKELGVENFYRYLSLVYPVHFSSLHSAPYIFERIKFLLKQKSYKPIHILYIDEAAMALPHLSYPSIYFSQKVISVGDPLQLEPVVVVSETDIERFHKRFYKDNIKLINRYSPARTSTYHRTARCETGNYDDFGEACFLDVHRRCQKPIAELFKIVAGYKRLEVATPPLKGEALRKLNRFAGKHLVFISLSEGKSTEKNTNLVEVETIKQLINKLIKAGYLKKEIIVITPFVKQEKLLKGKLRGILEYEKIGTVHKFQGQEAPVVIMSTVVQKGDSTAFIDSKPNLLNVAISRAKHLFIMIGNKKVLKTTNYFGKALNFIEENGKFFKQKN